LEVRRSGDGRPPFTEREREIHLNGTGGVKIQKKPGPKFRSGFFLKALKALKRFCHSGEVEESLTVNN
jgi:hypothetical protein